MSNLTIEFQQMFLLVNRKNGASVLLPAHQHTTVLSGSGLPGPIPLAAADVLIRHDGIDVVDRPTLRPGARYLPFLDYVFHASVVPRSAMKSLVVPPALNARVLLAGGYLTELPAADEQVAKVMWNFTKPDGRVVLQQALTDRLRFTLPLDEGGKYELIIRADGKDQVVPIAPEGADFIISNRDDTQKAVSDNGWYTLTEYALLYDLTTASTLKTLYPFPTADTSTVGGGGQPICGGGQSDDDGEDPPPPPGA